MLRRTLLKLGLGLCLGVHNLLLDLAPEPEPYTTIEWLIVEDFEFTDLSLVITPTDPHCRISTWTSSSGSMKHVELVEA